MPHLKLLEKGSHRSYRVDTEAVVGRDPSATIAVEGEAAKTVSGRHARFFMFDGKWFVEDIGSRNGTYIGTRKLEPGQRHQLSIGETIGLGLTGTQFVVEEAVGRGYAATMLEAQPAVPMPAGTIPMRRSEALRVGIHEPGGVQSRDEARVILRQIHTGARMVGQGDPVTIGRALECLIRVEGEAATSVSRTHCEITVLDGKPCIRDAGSRHGTFVNGKKLEGAAALNHGDLLMLGPGGPTYTVEEATVVPAGSPPPEVQQPKGVVQPTPTDHAAAHRDQPAKQVRYSKEEEQFAENPTPALAREAIKTTPKKPPPPPNAGPATRLARASQVVGIGRTAFVRDVLNQISSQNAKRTRIIAWSAVGVIAVITAVGGYYAKRHMDQTDARVDVASVGFKQQAAALDSLRASATSEAAAARASLDSAMSAAAPAAVLDSLRGAVADANRRSSGLEESLNRAKTSLDGQLKSADSIRQAATAELKRLKDQVSAAEATGADSRAVLDSLHRTLRAADERVKEVSGQVRALKGADFPQIALLNQGAVGLVTTTVGKDAWDGSGFVITPTGYMLTNRHVVRPEGASATDSAVVYVTMSDHSFSFRADVIMIAPPDGPDVALLKIRSYKGPVISKLDWSGTHAVQGEGAALIGFPAGYDNAADEQKVVRSSMTAGNFATVGADLIQFAGLSVAGSSGSPLFNGAGEVVGLHRAGLREKPGFGYAVPLARVAPLLPADVRAELGLAAK
jgi:pSer/pThr/pTyr-binding forkhead associated (FHA) protein/S1-C subfamily serine protease